MSLTAILTFLCNFCAQYLAKSALPTDDSLQRLESFFGDPPPGADPVPYAPRRHYRPARFTTPMNADQLVGEAPVVDQQAAASSSPTHSPAPVTLDTVADKLSSLTTEQLANLQNAVQQASSSLTELQSRASSQLSTLQEKVSASEPALAQLQDSVASLRHTAEEQLTHLYSSLTEVIGALKQNQATSQPLAPDIKPQQNVGGSRRKAPATKAVPEPEVAVRTRLQQDLQDGIAGMQQMTDAQLQNLQSALRMLQSELTERGQTLTAALQRGQATTAPAAQKTAAPARKQQRTAKLQEEKGVANVAVHNSLQDLGARGLENLRLAASAVRQAVSPLPQRLSESLRAPAINMPSLKTPSVGVPTLSIPTETAAAGLRGLLASHVWAWGIGVAIVILACIRWVSVRLLLPLTYYIFLKIFLVDFTFYTLISPVIIIKGVSSVACSLICSLCHCLCRGGGNGGVPVRKMSSLLSEDEKH